MSRRQSTRARKATNYDIKDAFRDLSDDPNSPATQLEDEQESASDDDFAAPEECADGANEELSDDEEPSEEDAASDGSDVSDAEISYDESDIDGTPKTKTPKTTTKGEQKTPGGNKNDDPSGPHKVHKTHQIAENLRFKDTPRKLLRLEDGSKPDLRIPDASVRITYRPGFRNACGKKDRLQHIFGANQDDLVKCTYSRDRALGLPAVPTRGSLGLSPFWDLEKEARNFVKNGWDAQKTEVLQYEDGEHDVPGYLPAEPEDPLRCIMGMLGEMKVVGFKRFGIHSLSDVKPGKNGYLLNCGGNPIGMDWGRNRPDGCQYLAISVVFDSPRLSGVDLETPPAFDRRACKSSIQIWRFPVTGDGKLLPPSLALVLCHNWGHATTLRWRPHLETLSQHDLGFLLAVCADGNVRVVRVKLPADETPESDYCHFDLYRTPAYTLTLPQPITTAAWQTSAAITVGTTTGAIANFPLTGSSTPTPSLYHPIHQGYIISLATCYPSWPNHILTSSMDGYSRVTSLLAPSVDSVQAHRSRMAPTTISWVDGLQSAISCEENTWIRAYPLRRFFSATSIAKHNGMVRCTATSVAHTLLLSGGSEGEAILSNPSRRCFHPKVRNYHLVWFGLEYAELPGAEKGKGTYRMVDGFGLEVCEHKIEKGTNNPNIYAAVYPKSVAVGNACWNQNVKYGGWATAGAFCGLVRVEDVVLDD